MQEGMKEKIMAITDIAEAFPGVFNYNELSNLRYEEFDAWWMLAKRKLNK